MLQNGGMQSSESFSAANLIAGILFGLVGLYVLWRFCLFWRNFGYVEIAGTRAELGRNAVGTIVLSPPSH